MSSAIERLAAVREELKSKFKEREQVVDGLFIALIAMQNVLLLGPPGTGKSLLVRKFYETITPDAMGDMAKGGFFQFLMGKFTLMDDIFGPVSFEGLKKDKLRRVTSMRLPEASVFFADEIFKSSPAILQSLLMALEERMFVNGDGAEEMPLEITVGASNEYPDDDEGLEALFDRFTVRFWVEYISDRDNMEALLVDGVSDIENHLEDGDIEELREIAETIPLEGVPVGLLLDVKAGIKDAGFTVSDRRWVKAKAILRASAVINGRKHITPEDFRALSNSLWDQHTDKDRMSKVIGLAADPFGYKALAISDLADAAVRSLPDLALLEQKPAHELVADVTKVSGQLQDMRKKLNQLTKDALDAGVDAPPQVVEACKKVDGAMSLCEKRSIELIRSGS